MDLGAAVCTARAPRCLICPLKQDCAAAPVAPRPAQRARQRVPFERTTRYARGRIIDRLRDLPAGRRISLLDLHGQLETTLQHSPEELRGIVDDLQRDGLVHCNGESVALPE